MSLSAPQLAGGVVVGAVLTAALTMERHSANTASAAISELWQEPGDIAALDLRWGRGGPALAPSPDTAYEFVAVDATGYSAGYDVIDPQGRRWDVKTGDESQPEVVSSRLLWAIGYHQPIVYFVPEWKMTNGPVDKPLPGRFRLSSDHSTLGDWAWSDNPFKGTREFKGLLVASLLVNNWDLKSTNNRIYSVPAANGWERWFVVQDVGASLGKTGWPVGNRNRAADFERQRFVLGVEQGRVQFDYQARHRELLGDITPGDVVWTCRLLARITDTQWNDLFAAVAMPPETSERYIRKLKSKIEEGLALQADVTGH